MSLSPWDVIPGSRTMVISALSVRQNKPLSLSPSLQSQFALAVLNMLSKFADHAVVPTANRVVAAVIEQTAIVESFRTLSSMEGSVVGRDALRGERDAVQGGEGRLLEECHGATPSSASLGTCEPGVQPRSASYAGLRRTSRVGALCTGEQRAEHGTSNPPDRRVVTMPSVWSIPTGETATVGTGGTSHTSQSNVWPRTRNGTESRDTREQDEGTALKPRRNTGAERSGRKWIGVIGSLAANQP
ncbi:hypothetical protein Save01_06771 [Streptomyces avermitilis]